MMFVSLTPEKYIVSTDLWSEHYYTKLLNRKISYNHVRRLTCNEFECYIMEKSPILPLISNIVVIVSNTNINK